MGSISATAARKNLYSLIASVNESSVPVVITKSRGKGAVLIGEDDWAAIEETLYLNGIPGMVPSLEEALLQPLDECVDANDLEW